MANTHVLTWQMLNFHTTVITGIIESDDTPLMMAKVARYHMITMMMAASPMKTIVANTRNITTKIMTMTTTTTMDIVTTTIITIRTQPTHQQFPVSNVFVHLPVKMAKFQQTDGLHQHARLSVE